MSKRYLVLSVVMAGCGFSAGATTADNSGSDAATSNVIDASDVHGGDATVSIDARALDAYVKPPPDACPDADNDGVCDDVDTWPCGAQPASPPSTVSYNNGSTNQTLTFTDIDIGSDQLLVVAPGATITYGFTYALTDKTCGGDCIDQIEVGLVVGKRLACATDSDVSKQNGASGTLTNKTVTAPTTAGSYDFRFDIGQNTSCGASGNNSWWPSGTDPPDGQTLAHVCVHS